MADELPLRRMKLPRFPSLPPNEPGKLAFFSLFAGAVIAFLPHTQHQPLWLSGLFVLFVLWRVLLLKLDRKPPGIFLRFGLTVAMLFLVVAHYHTIFGRSAGSALLIVFAGLKILETRDLRDAMFCNSLIMVIVLSAFLFDQSPATAAYGLLSLVIVVANFHSLIAPRGFSLKRVIKLTLLVLLNGIPLALAVYILFPRIEGSLWGIAPDPFQSTTGIGEEMSPGDVNRLSLNDAVAFRVTFEGDAPALDQLYWRVKVLNQFNGRVWRRVQTGGFIPRTEAGADSREYRYNVSLEITNRTWLPVLDAPTGIDAIGRVTGNNLGVSFNKILQRTRFDATAIIPGYSVAKPDRMDTVINAGMSEPVERLARDFSAAGADAFETARRILDYFRNQDFYYTLEPPLMGRDPVDQFLFEERRGYCEHYASAFTTLMRIAGFPARVVTGYQGGEFNENGNYYIVRQSDAHAWAEIWIADQGWTRVDPTAAVAPERIEYGLDALRRLDERELGGLSVDEIDNALKLSWWELQVDRLWLFSDAMTFQWNRWVMSYGPEQQKELLRKLGIDEPDWGWMALSLMICFAIFLLATYLVLSRRGIPPESPRKYFHLFQKRLAKVGINEQTGEGPWDFSRRAAAELPANSSEILSIGSLYTKLRYGTPDPALELSNLKRKVSEFHPGKSNSP